MVDTKEIKTALISVFHKDGLEDILNFQVRPTPHFLENEDRMELYRTRLSKKNWQEKWKNLIFKNSPR
ncbi:nucleotidyltransferase family protein [uncultured Aggregatibacter sp.]|uniref:nucleotidyltransferase family protein n=1 Tax=uncultured Aggregatibacter sp. TaxID=470564 RepID=UPI003450810C